MDQNPKYMILQIIGDLVMIWEPRSIAKHTGIVWLLRAANYRDKEDLSIFIGIKSVIAPLCGLIAMKAVRLEDPRCLLVIIPAFFLGWFVPNAFLSFDVMRRQSEILYELPTMVDLLIVYVQEHLPLKVALQKFSRLCTDFCPVLVSELTPGTRDLANSDELATGVLRSCAERCGVEELIKIADVLDASPNTDAELVEVLQKISVDAHAYSKKREREKLVRALLVFGLCLTFFAIVTAFASRHIG
jgi:tight adherence protein C